jgi:hypothetical protein
MTHAELLEEEPLTIEKMPNLTQEEAAAFVEKNIKKLPQNMTEGLITADMISCIDDRKTDGEPKIRIPGAGLGLLMDTLGAHLEISNEDLATAVEQALGGKLSYHTDKNHEGDPLKCAGCGHCAGALSKPGEYLLTPEAVAFLQKKYLPQLDKKCIAPEVYPGDHGANGVLILKGPISITSEGDELVYVYHPDFHKLAIEQIARKISDMHPDLDADIVAAAIWDSAQERLGHTVHHLAEHLPKFEVTQSEDGKVEVKKVDF